MRILSTLFFVLIYLTSLSAQEPMKSELAPCGAPAGLDPWLLQFKKRPQDFVIPRSDDTLYIGLQIHLLANDNGTGRFPYEKLLTAFCQLNTDYAASHIRFYFKNPWNLLNNTAWYNHATIPQGAAMMLTNNQPDVLNIYFVGNPAGNCGYNLPYGGVAIAHGCAAPGDHTWAHEVGHGLSLPHPFLGWEGKTYKYNVPTPDSVLYDYTYFHSTPDTAQTPLDTALVERVDGSNCHLASDLFCDTKPDYLSYRWDCDNLNMSTVKEKDQAGADFYSDGTLFMSYSLDACQSRFSDEQIAAMRSNVLSVKQTWLSPGPPEPDIQGTTSALYPVGDQITADQAVTLTWSKVPHATHYLVIGSRLNAFQVDDIVILTTDTTAVTGVLLPNKKYYWHVRPFNDWYACAPFSATESFVTAPATAVTTPDESGFRAFPTLLAPGQSVQLELPASWAQQAIHSSLVDATGRLMWESSGTATDRSYRLELPSMQWKPGFYALSIHSETGWKTIRLCIY